MKRPHPPYCHHCKMVQEYRDQRAAELDAYWNPKTHDGGWRDPHAWGRIITFKHWLQTYKYEKEPVTMSEPRLPRPLPVYDVASDRYTNDDYYIEKWKCTILNRIDQEWGCDHQISWNGDFGVPEYCGLPEHDPFTARCWDYTPGNLTSGHM